MLDGEILKFFIENQRISKQKIADDLKMSRSNLYQFFDTKELSTETKRKFEDYFKQKIFTEEAIANYTASMKNLALTPAYGKNPTIKPNANGQESDALYNRSLDNLVESNRLLAEANKALAEANKTLSKNSEDLIQLTKVAFGMQSGIKKGKVKISKGQSQQANT